MTDFSHARTVKCCVCGQPFCNVEGKLCDCFRCIECGESFHGFYKGGIEGTDESYCEFCREEVAGRCDKCGNWYLKEALIEGSFCKDCAEEEG